MAIKRLDPKVLHDHKGVSFVGIGVVFFCHDGKGRFLMSKNSQKTRDEQGRWEIAGGGMKWGMSPEDTVRREMKEEFDATAKTIEFMGYRNVFRKLEDGTPTHWLMMDYAVEIDPKEAKRNEPDMADEIGWFTLDTQPSPTHSQHETFMKKYQKQIKKILKSH